MTLRARLLLGLLVLAALGLGVAGTVTYRQTGDDLRQRVDNQLSKASQEPSLFFNRFRGAVDNPADSLLPPGTWAQVREVTTGDVLGTNPGALRLKPPHLPDKLVIDKTFTVSSPHYRVYVAPPEQFTIVDSTGFPQQRVQASLIVAIPMSDVDLTLHHLLAVELIVAIIVLLLLAGLAWVVVKLGLRPLEEMQTTANAIAAGDLSRRIDVTDPHTEVGQLGLALNEMLHQIEQAFAQRAASEARLRRFVGDASHELRTPLTSIRGYAELFRRGAAERPEDLAKTMRRIEQEADRMGVMVDDLLLLARLDQGRPLERKPVDLTRITSDAVDDTRAVAPDRLISYSPNGAIIVPGDEVRLRQVLANLLQNAVRHTPPETPVLVQVTSDTDNATIEVADRGPGMSPEDANRVFERFWRADASRTRASGGTGLGLAIVAAIADAHGGSVSVDTAPGEGATFRVRLPRVVAPAQPEPEPAPASDATPIADLEDVEIPLSSPDGH